MSKVSNELRKFKNHFDENCMVKVVGLREDSHCPHWKRLIFSSLNAQEMLELSRYIKATFTVDGTYTHLLPSIGTFDNCLTLTVDAKLIKQQII